MKSQTILKLAVGVLTAVQLFTGFIFLQNSSINEEQRFVSAFQTQHEDPHQQQNRELANYLNHLPDDSRILVDDAVAYPVVAFTNDMHKLVLPYESVFLSAFESPDKYENYILLTTDKNEVKGFTQLDDKYAPVMKKLNSAIIFQKVYESDDWVLYKIFDN